MRTTRLPPCSDGQELDRRVRIAPRQPHWLASRRKAARRMTASSEEASPSQPLQLAVALGYRAIIDVDYQLKSHGNRSIVVAR